VLVLLILGLVIGLTGSETGRTISEEPIKIGVTVPLTGNAAIWGEEISKGIDLAVEEINSNGGINGRKIRIIYEDSSDPTTATTAAQKLINTDNVKIIITAFSSLSNAIRPITEKNKIILIADNHQPIFGMPGDYTFRSHISGEEQHIEIMEFLEKNEMIEDTGIIAENSAYTQGMINIIRPYFERNGKKLFVEYISADQKDFRTNLIRLKEKNVKIIFSASIYYQINALIIKQKEELGIVGQIIVPDYVCIESNSLFDYINPQIAEGIIYPKPLGSEEGNAFTETARKFFKKYKEKYGFFPKLDVATLYDAINFLEEPLEECGEDTECIKEELYHIKNFKSVYGAVYIDKNGDTRGKEFFIKIIRDGQFVEY